MKTKEYLDRQSQTPYLDEYVSYLKSDPTPFDVPGHKLGFFETDLDRKLSHDFSRFDANAPYGMDNLANPKTVIKQAEKLAAEAFNADHCLFSVNGTTGGILTMFLSTLDTKDKVVLPRNVHKSVINSLILSGAIPIFIDPDIDNDLGVACGVSYNSVVKALDENKDAKAIFLINPTYFGVCSDLKRITAEAHKRNVIVMVDEAHGSNFYFSNKLPISAMSAGCDISAVSLHKNSGSLTQTSLILVKGNRVNFNDVKKAFTMVTSTSPNSVLLASIDAARKEMAIRGNEILNENLELAKYAREEINKIKGLHCYSREYINKGLDCGRFDIDETKLVIDVRGLDMFGYEAYKELRKISNIQVELGEVSVILALIGPGTVRKDIDNLIEALNKLSELHYSQKKKRIPKYNYSFPTLAINPRDAFDSPYKTIKLKDSIGEISAETIMIYPPGIPLVIPGERITKDVIRLIDFFHKEGGEVLKDTSIGKIKIVNISL